MYSSMLTNNIIIQHGSVSITGYLQFDLKLETEKKIDKILWHNTQSLLNSRMDDVVHIPTYI